MENSKIEWCDHTFNPWVGCVKVSDGCNNCYAEALMDKRFGRVAWGPGPKGVRVRTSAHYWKQPLLWNKRAEQEGKRARVFCASLADVFEDKQDQPEIDDWLGDLFRLIVATPYLDWLLLTKRPENVNLKVMFNAPGSELPGNVWIGTSVENQAQADKRIPELLEIPARVHFLSMEPLLGPVDLKPVMGIREVGGIDRYEHIYADWIWHLDWIIVGGESGPNARPMHPKWVISIQKQCAESGTPFFFKQWGEWLPNNQVWPTDYKFKSGELVKLWEPGVTGFHSRKIGKKEAGRLLDGVEWNQLPEVHHAD